jgi:hypothetical protein
MFAAYEKCSRPTFAPEEKCLRPMKNGAKKGKKSEIEIKRKQLNNYELQKSEISVTSEIEEHKNKNEDFQRT